MQIPNLPTDNLYKFMALSGLVIIVLSIWYPLSHLSNVRQRTVELRAELKVLKLEVDRLGAGLAMDPSVKAPTSKSDKRSPIKKAENAQNNANGREMGDSALLTKTDNVEMKVIQLEAKGDALGYLASELTDLVNLMSLGVGFGALLTCLGFTLWYVRVQKPQDAFLRQQMHQRSSAGATTDA